MADFTYSATFAYNNFGAIWLESPEGLTDPFGPVTFSDTNRTFELGDDFTGDGNMYMGYLTLDNVRFPIVSSATGNTDEPLILVPEGRDASKISFPDSIRPFDFRLINLGESMRHPHSLCFAKGTLIRVPAGEVAVEKLTNNHEVVTENGTAVKVKWIGRQTMWRMFSGVKALNMVRFEAGALGNGLPETELTVTGGHGMIVDGYVVNASALVNETSITQIPIAQLPERFTVYHVETENHDVILANGAAAETFVDVVSRANFDNYQEYLDLYGVERIIPEMAHLRISSRRLLPDVIKARLGIADIHYTEESYATRL